MPDEWDDAVRQSTSDAAGLLRKREIALAGLVVSQPERIEEIATILEGTSARDPDLEALWSVLPHCITEQELVEALIQKGHYEQSARILTATVHGPSGVQAEDAVRIAQAVALSRVEEEAVWAASEQDLDRALALLRRAETMRARFAGADEPFPFEPRSLRAPEAIPRREWLYGRVHLRRSVGALIAPPGHAKSSVAMVEALAMATGRKLLHDFPHERCRVLIWNLEEPREEIERRLAAVAKHFEIAPADYEGYLFFESGHEHPLKLATTGKRGGYAMDDVALGRLRRTIEELHLDVVIIDPFVSAHGVPENDNSAMDGVLKALGAIATQTGCAICLVHHVRKGPVGSRADLEADDARGASAFVGACRSIRMVQRMSSGDAATLNVDERERWRYARIIDGKMNYAPPAEKSEWIELVSVDLFNGPEGGAGDSVGVPQPWKAPSLTDGLPANIREIVREEASGARYRSHHTAEHWFGQVIGRRCGIDASSAPAQKRLKRLIKQWLQEGIIIVVEKPDGTRQMRPFIGTPEDGN